ncbi:Uncharacterized protein Fot_50503 [Forsythia ovata]|uniref:Uncharacterized protein n=1 Tax=Forsythia ovata TaxID=205694 RepID=A0ABD1PYC1_9LAMI
MRRANSDDNETDSNWIGLIRVCLGSILEDPNPQNDPSFLREDRIDPQTDLLAASVAEDLGGWWQRVMKDEEMWQSEMVMSDLKWWCRYGVKSDLIVGCSVVVVEIVDNSSGGNRVTKCVVVLWRVVANFAVVCGGCGLWSCR